ncbi:uncharacterized protein LOC121111306 [Gallus gallus]|uniref:uncharacterized protein LOC121111306 n=1 Tax=Gallus gallus TaxID=9031 RepID=UPI001F00C1F6|nr:uncharacterized protein LOC121111306 [Gallus gallus]
MLPGWGTCAGPCEAVLLPRTAPTSRPCCRVRCRALSVLHILADPATRPVGSLKAGRARTAPPQSPALHPAGRCSPPTRSSRNSSPAPGSAGTTSACAPHDSGRFPSFCAFVFLLTSAGVALWAGMRRSPAEPVFKWNGSGCWQKGAQCSLRKEAQPLPMKPYRHPQLQPCRAAGRAILPIPTARTAASRKRGNVRTAFMTRP